MSKRHREVGVTVDISSDIYLAMVGEYIRHVVQSLLIDVMPLPKGGNTVRPVTRSLIIIRIAPSIKKARKHTQDLNKKI